MVETRYEWKTLMDIRGKEYLFKISAVKAGDEWDFYRKLIGGINEELVPKRYIPEVKERLEKIIRGEIEHKESERRKWEERQSGIRSYNQVDYEVSSEKRDYEKSKGVEDKVEKVLECEDERIVLENAKPETKKISLSDTVSFVRGLFKKRKK